MWLPIEQAPKDGTIIDIWEPDWERICDVYWDSKLNIWRKGSSCFSGATHFMYVPDSPATEIKFEPSDN